MIVVTDTSVVLNLCWLRRETLLTVIYEEVIAPEEVRLEFERKAARYARFTGAVALSLGLRVSGLLGILIAARQRRLLPELRPLLDQLISGARFWISPALRERALRQAGENPKT